MSRVKLFREWTESFLRGDGIYDKLSYVWKKDFSDNNTDFDHLDKWKKRDAIGKEYIKYIISEEFPDGLLHFTDERIFDILDSLTDIYGDYDKALSEMYEHIMGFEKLDNKGGRLYRLVYVDSVDDINLDDMGKHWTIDYYIIDDLEESGWEEKFGNGKKYPFVLTIDTEPHNVSIDGVDIENCPEEKEVNIVDFKRTTLVSVEPFTD
jgi:hypothetical protein